jgi:hypothetical protein
MEWKVKRSKKTDTNSKPPLYIYTKFALTQALLTWRFPTSRMAMKK